MFFDGTMAMLRVLAVSILSYGALVALLRISGKRSLAKLNAFDLVVTIALGSTLATIILSKDVALAEGLLALAMLLFLQWGVARLSMVSSMFQKLARSQPRLLLEDGRYRDDAMREERITRPELESVLRQQGHGELSGIAAVILETDGSLSVIPGSRAADMSLLASVRR